MNRRELLKIAKPILFNTEMVQSILEGRKTVTSRLIKLQPPKGYEYSPQLSNLFYAKFLKSESQIHLAKTPYMAHSPTTERIGDILYVREKTFGTAGGIDNQDLCYATHCSCGFSDEEHAGVKGWTPSIHMPKKAARIFLKVTDVRVEKIKDITEEQAISEGFNSREEFTKSILEIYPEATEESWVWVIEFEVLEI